MNHICSAEEIYLEQSPRVGFRGFFHRSEKADTRIVDQNIDPGEMCFCGFDHFPALLPICDIQG